MAQFETSAQGHYDTPPSGDFVRYVDSLLAQQAQWMSVGHSVQDVGSKPVHSIRAGKTTAISPPAVALPNAVVTKTAQPSDKTNKVETMLERIRELEQRRHTQEKGLSTTTAPVAVAQRAKGTGFQLDESRLLQPEKSSGFSWVMVGLGSVLGMIFPPLGVLMLLNLWRKRFSSNAKK